MFSLHKSKSLVKLENLIFVLYLLFFSFLFINLALEQMPRLLTPLKLHAKLQRDGNMRRSKVANLIKYPLPCQ